MIVSKKVGEGKGGDEWGGGGVCKEGIQSKVDERN